MKANEDIVAEYFRLNPNNRFLMGYRMDLNGLLESAKINWQVPKLEAELEVTKTLLQQAHERPLYVFYNKIKRKWNQKKQLK